MITKEELMPLLNTAIILVIAAFVGTLFTETSAKSMFSLALAVFAYVILPGYCILLNFKLTNLERIIFAMPISITSVSITLYSIDLFGIPLNRMTTISVILIISFFGVALMRYTQASPSS